MSSHLQQGCVALLNLLCTVCPMDVTQILGEKKKQRNKTKTDISPRKYQRERERAFALEKLLHVPQNSPNGPLEESRNLGTDCMKSFELHKMLMVALSQASCWQRLRVSNKTPKYLFTAWVFSVTQFAAQLLILYIELFLLYSCY